MGIVGVGLLFAMTFVAIAWAGTRGKSRRIRVTAVLVAIGCFVLMFWSFLAAAGCSLSENRSDLFYARCDAGVPWITLLGIPALLFLAVKAEKLNLAVLWLLGLAAFLVPVLVPYGLLSV